MTDLSITAANVVAGADAKTAEGVFGETVTAGQAVAENDSGYIVKADSNSATAALRAPIGIALNGGAINQPCRYVRKGAVTIGATLSAGVAYYLSDTPGGICPVADVGSGEYPTILGMATSTTVLEVDIQSAGVAL